MRSGSRRGRLRGATRRGTLLPGLSDEVSHPARARVVACATDPIRALRRCAGAARRSDGDARRTRPSGSPSSVLVVSDPAGWYPDPTTRHELRYWDGYAWLDNVSDK